MSLTFQFDDFTVQQAWHEIDTAELAIQTISKYTLPAKWKLLTKNSTKELQSEIDFLKDTMKRITSALVDLRSFKDQANTMKPNDQLKKSGEWAFESLDDNIPLTCITDSEFLV